MKNIKPLEAYQNFEENTKVFLCVLEGIKTRLKALHWSTNILAIHKQIDEVLNDINLAQDSIAEEVQGLFGRYQELFLKSIVIEVDDYCEMLNFIKNRFIDYGTTLPDNIKYGSIKGICEDIIGKINKYEYLTDIIMEGRNNG